ncbi:serine hydrolase [Stieleria sp.]|uniref:serine hydrolase n=1 Tax=Stieleria sp. TaxID=2795976 RepID=UPI003563AA90
MGSNRQYTFRPVGESLEQRRLLAAIELPAVEMHSELSGDVAVAQVSESTASTQSVAAAAATGIVARHRMTSTQYNAEVARLQDLGYRPFQVSGYELAGQDYYAAIWKPTGSTAWQARHGMTSSQYQQEFTALVGQGYRLTHVNGYTIGGIDRYAAIWENSSGPGFYARHRMTGSQLQNFDNDYTSQGYRITKLSGYAIGSQSYYAAIWQKQSGPAYVWRYGLTSAEFQEQSGQFAASGYDVVDVSGYSVGGVDYYAGIWEQQSTTSGVLRHALSSSQYQSEFDALLAQGYELRQVDGYTVGGIDRYVASWTKPAQAFTELPISGTMLPQLSALTETVEQFMIERQIPAGSIAISKDGQLLGEIGLGWSDHDQTDAIDPDAMFRLASVTKPMTDAVVTKLISEGVLSLDDQVFCTVGASDDCLLDITPWGTPDARLSQINVGHLLEHRGGWDRDLSGDPVFNQIAIAGALGIHSPPNQYQIAQYVLGQPLDFDPGTRYAYSNFGYMILGLVVENKTGRDFTEYLQNEIFRPIGVANTEIELGRSLPDDRNAREPNYRHPSLGTSVFDTSQLVAFPDGAFHLESMESFGGQIASARAVTSFLDRYWISGERRSGGSANYTFYGSLPGTVTMARQRLDGFNVVVLLNQRTDAAGNTYDVNVLKSRVDAVLDTVDVSITTQDTIGLYQGDTSLFHLKESFGAGPSDQYFAFGPSGNAGWTPLVGDWNGDGTDTIGLYQGDASLFHLKDSFSPGAADHYFAFGPAGAGWIPLAGDWNGDGIDTIGLYQPDVSLFHLKDSTTPGASDHYFAFGPGGNAGWTPVVGDWDGDGKDTIGLYQPDASLFHLKNSFTAGASDQYFAFGPGGNAGWTPMAGDWNGDGTETIGLYQPDVSLFHLKDSFTPGAADHYFAFGPSGNAGWIPLAGDWNGPTISASSTAAVAANFVSAASMPAAKASPTDSSDPTEELTASELSTRVVRHQQVDQEINAPAETDIAQTERQPQNRTTPAMSGTSLSDQELRLLDLAWQTWS